MSITINLNELGADNPVFVETIQQWLALVETGEDVVFVASGKPVARLAAPDLPIITTNSVTKVTNPKKRREAGKYIDKELSPEFFLPLDDDELTLWDQ